MLSKLLTFFRKKKQKNYLRIYANWGKPYYSEKEKEELVMFFCKIVKELYAPLPIKYDILGSGYGISKGGPFLGQKAFDNKLMKKGYKNLYGVTIKQTDEIYSHFILLENDFHGDACRMELTFDWPHEQDLKLKKALDLLIEISKKLEIKYAYAYPADIKMNFYENAYRTYASKSQKAWSQRMQEIKDGMIKEICPVNFFNYQQLSKLSNIEPDEKIQLNNMGEIWLFEGNTTEINKRAINAVIR